MLASPPCERFREPEQEKFMNYRIVNPAQRKLEPLLTVRCDDVIKKEVSE